MRKRKNVPGKSFYSVNCNVWGERKKHNKSENKPTVITMKEHPAFLLSLLKTPLDVLCFHPNRMNTVK